MNTSTGPIYSPETEAKIAELTELLKEKKDALVPLAH
jgi:hypothetical protein